jgi:hypothetical protein
LEILRAYAQLYASASFAFGFNMQSVFERNMDSTGRQAVVIHLKELREECDRIGLPMTSGIIGDALLFFDSDENFEMASHDQLSHVCKDLQRELALQFFIRIPPERRERFESPFVGWEKIIARFGSVSRDVEEMNKCFALCRYTAAMFHGMQIAESGAIALGSFIGVTDPKPGWGPTERELEKLMKLGRGGVVPKFKRKFDFLEQMHREIDSMVLAWRHKIDHSANTLALIPNTDFTPDIAEHIIGAVRIFMLRLAEGMPDVKGTTKL